ncbi:hypothetical protein ACUVMQ_21485, partial [Aeromonas veronii]|uniref:hypothetical protein n=1 Tax=Aeromonas veronii TaxID=654 RepID=UPI0040558F7F
MGNAALAPNKINVESAILRIIDEASFNLGRRESNFLKCLIYSPEYKQCKSNLKQKIWPERNDV